MKTVMMIVVLASMAFVPQALKAEPDPISQPELTDLRALIFQEETQAQPELPETTPAPEPRHDVTCGGDYCTYTSCACHVECDNQGLFVVFYECYPRMEEYACTCGW